MITEGSLASFIESMFVDVHDARVFFVSQMHVFRDSSKISLRLLSIKQCGENEKQT